MKRWILYVLVAVAVLVLLAPGLVGLLTERTIERQLEIAAGQQPGVDVRTERFDRGWFTSEGQHRVPVTSDALAALLTFLTPGTLEPDSVRLLIIETTIAHGPVTFGDTGGGAGRLLPALASGASTLEVELDDGRRLPVPGRLASRVSLNGAATVEYRLPAGAAAHGEVTARWDDSRIVAGTNHDGREQDIGFEMRGLQLETEGRRMRVASATGSGELRATPWGYALGKIALDLRDGESSGVGAAVTLQGLRLRSASARDDGRVGATLELDLEGLENVAGGWSGRVAASAVDFDGAALGPLIRGLQRGTAGGGRPAAYPGIDIDLRRALSAGGRLTLSEFVVETPDGRANAVFDVALEARDGLAEWAGLALATEARAELTLSRSLMNSPGFEESLRSLLAAGMLVVDGEDFRMEATLSNGIATINGAPMPVPVN